MHVSRSHSQRPHSTCPQTLLLGLATLAALGLAARPASAQIVTQFNSPITTVTSPSGNETLMLSGLVTNFGSASVDGAGASSPSFILDSSGDQIPIAFDGSITSLTFAPGTSTPVSFLIASIAANQAPGLYNIASNNGGEIPTLTLYFSDNEQTNTNFAVNVIPAAPAPEPSSTAGLGLGVLGLAGLMLKAHRRKPLTA